MDPTMDSSIYEDIEAMIQAPPTRPTYEHYFIGN